VWRPFISIATPENVADPVGDWRDTDASWAADEVIANVRAKLEKLQATNQQNAHP
jgi:hypothetical protein